MMLSFQKVQLKNVGDIYIVIIQKDKNSVIENFIDGDHLDYAANKIIAENISYEILR